MLGDLAALAVASILSVGSFATSFVAPTNTVISPLAQTPVKAKVQKTPTPTQLPSPTPTIIPTKIPATPTATPTPTVVITPTPIVTSSVTGPELDNLFTIYSGQYGIDREQLRKIAACESGFNSNANNLIYGGMYQFSEGSWMSTRSAMGLSTDPALRYNAEESVRTAAFKLSQPNGANAWPSCK